MDGYDPELDGLARRLRMARASAYMTQEEAARGAGVSQSALSAYERGRREPMAIPLARLARVYGVEVGWLFGTDR